MAEEHARITPEMLERVRSHWGRWHERPEPWYNSEVTVDAVRHNAMGYGDRNPLYLDPEYGKKTKYGRMIAPPTFLYGCQWTSGGGGVPGFSGIHGWYSGGNWDWYRPVYLGDAIKVRTREVGYVEKAGKMGGGRTFVAYSEVVYRNQRDEIVAKEICWSVLAERAASGAVGKYRGIGRPEYSEEEWARMAEAYDKEEIRGTNPRYWEDVQIGDKLGPVLKGPLTVRDMLACLMGTGSPFFKTHGIEHAWELIHPAGPMFVHDTTGIPGNRDVPELVHIVDGFAREIGVERAYDYGHQRVAWLMNLLSNWAGDDGWIWKARGDLRVFNQVGDATWYEGKVTKKYRVGGKCCVEVEARAKNQRDEYSLIPNPAVIILPSKQYGPAVYPEPEIKELAELQERIKGPLPGWFAVVTG